MLVDWLTALAVVVASGLGYLTWKLFFAPIVPAGFDSFSTIPGERTTRFGKFIGDFPYHDMRRNHRHFRDLTTRFGTIVRKRVLTRDIMIIADLALGGEILKDREHFMNRPFTGIVAFAPKGLLALETTEEWKAHRRAISPMFADRFMKLYCESIVRVNHVLVERLDKVPEQKQIDVHDVLSALSLDIIGLSGFGCEFNAVRSGDKKFTESGEAVLTACILLTVFPPFLYKLFFPKLSKESYEGKAVFINAIEATMNEMGSDATHMLAQLHSAGFSKQDIIDELLTMVMAGHETSANAMSWCVYLLGKYPEVLKKLQNEIDSVYAEPAFTEDNLFAYRTRFPYLKSCLLETLRLYPTVPQIPRLCTKATKVKNYDVFPGVTVFVSAFSAFRHPTNFPDRPDEFVPERHLGTSGEDIDNASFYPFGAGDRICIGRRFAMNEMLISLAMLLKRYEFKLDPSHTVVEVGHITLTPGNGIFAFVHPRNVA